MNIFTWSQKTFSWKYSCKSWPHLSIYTPNRSRARCRLALRHKGNLHQVAHCHRYLAAASIARTALWQQDPVAAPRLLRCRRWFDSSTLHRHPQTAGTLPAAAPECPFHMPLWEQHLQHLAAAPCKALERAHHSNSSSTLQQHPAAAPCSSTLQQHPAAAPCSSTILRV